MRLFGHPVHPMLVHLPIALWVLATACDGLTLAGVGQAWPLAWLCLATGLAAALPAMAAGLADFAGLEDSAAPTATRHMTLMGLAWSAYLAALILRSDGLAVREAPVPLAMAAGLAGFVALIAGAIQGGRLVYTLGVGVRKPEG
jgi:uncharacterized membrane protein